MSSAGCLVCRKHHERGPLMPGGRVHLLPRYPGTPREYWGVNVNKYPQARRGGTAEAEALVRDLRRATPVRPPDGCGPAA
jgi:hypothetical protein